MATQALPFYNQRRPPVFDPNNPTAMADQGPDAFTPPGGAGPADAGPAAPGVDPVYGNPAATTIPSLNLDPNAPIHNTFYGAQGQIQAGGQQINQEAQSQLAHYGPRQSQYEGLSDTALQDLKATPGYTGDEASKIGVDYSKFATSPDALNKRYLSPEEQAGIAGDPNAPVNKMAEGTAAEGAMLNQYQQGVGDQLSAYQGDLSGQVSNYGKGVGGAVDTLGTGLDKAQGKFSKLDTAVTDPGLAFDPNATEKQLTDADVQQMKTAAGTRVGNAARTQEDTLEREAAAAGNTSPLALAAARSRIQSQSAADQGDAEVNADIAARQAQYGRAAGIEGQRLGASQTSAGMRAGAATTEEVAAQNAAALAGTQGIAAAEKVGQTGIDAANTYNTTALNQLQNYGQFSTNTAADMAGKGYGAALTAEQEAAGRAGTLATNRQATTGDVQNTQYGQGMQTTGATSAGAQTVGGARIAGEAAYRSGVAGQQGAAQQGGQTAVDQQLRSYGTQTQGINQSTANRANYEVGGQGNSALNQATKVVGAVLGHAEGGVVEEPTLTTLGEKGAEVVIPLMPRYRSGMREQVRKAA